MSKFAEKFIDKTANGWTRRVQHHNNATYGTDGKNFAIEFNTNQPDDYARDLSQWLTDNLSVTLSIEINAYALERALKLAKVFEDCRLIVIKEYGQLSVCIESDNVSGGAITRIEASQVGASIVDKVSYITSIDASKWLKAMPDLKKLDYITLGIDTMDLSVPIKVGNEGEKLFMTVPFSDVSASRIDDNSRYFDYSPMTEQDAKNTGKKHRFAPLFKRKKHTPKFMDRKPVKSMQAREKFVKNHHYITSKWGTQVGINQGYKYNDSFKQPDGSYIVPVETLNLRRKF